MHFSSAYWHARAEETRVLAEEMPDHHIQQSLLEMAQQHEKLAEYAEQQEHRGQRPRFG